MAEPDGEFRSVFQRDRDRIVHSLAFRRLEYKTQVFVNFEGDHFRTRLTHSLEVAQIARTISRALGVDEDLAEAVALAHDLGHTPFGHAGEAALDTTMRSFGGFDHNLQTFRIVTQLEQRYAAFDGLNLTFEALEGVVKHHGPLTGRLPSPISEHPLSERLNLETHAPLEAQIAAIADDVAYVNHDIDDGLRAAFFTLDDLRSLPVVGTMVEEVRARWPQLAPGRLTHEVNRRLIGRMVSDLVEETRRRLSRLGPDSPEDVRRASEAMVGFTDEVGEAVTALRGFLRERMYSHYKVNRMTLKAQRLVKELAHGLLEAPECLPGRWREAADVAGSVRTAHTVRDYIAGMTDRYALNEHDRLFKLTRDSE